jgi:hypothetical protein
MLLYEDIQAERIILRGMALKVEKYELRESGHQQELPNAKDTAISVTGHGNL